MKQILWAFCALVVANGPARGETVAVKTPRPVISEIVSQSANQLREFPGVVVARATAVLAFQTNGTLLERSVGVGDEVKKGQVLARVEQTDAQDDVAAARAALASAQIKNETATASLKRAMELKRRNVATSAQVTSAKTAAASTAAELENAQANLTRAEDALTYARLVAPADGVVVDVYAEPGTVVSAGKPVLSVATDEGLDAVIDVPQSTLSLFSKGDGFIVSSRFGDLSVRGTLRLVEPVVNEATRTRRLRIGLPTGETGFRIGSLIRATQTGAASQTLSVPQTAVLERDGQSYVWRIRGKDRSLEQVPVTLGAALSGQRVLVRDGLAVGDEVLVKGVHSVEAGQQVGPGQTL